jgi:hypothetical protein
MFSHITEPYWPWLRVSPRRPKGHCGCGVEVQLGRMITDFEVGVLMATAVGPSGTSGWLRRYVIIALPVSH